MVFIVKDPILTYFNSLSTSFYGFGVNLRLVDGEVTSDFKSQCSSFGSSLKFARVLVSTPDPSFGALAMTNLSDMDNIFSSAPYSVDGVVDEETQITSPSTAKRFFSDILSMNLKTVFCFIPPTSWLDADGVLSGENALSGYANYILSGMLWVRTLGIAADLVEIFPEPDSISGQGYGFIYPKELVVIANRIRDLSIIRHIVEPSIKTLGPGLSSVLPTIQDQELWTESFVYARRALDVFSLHCLEHSSDNAIYNAGTTVSRKMLERCLRKSVAQMNSINFELDKFATGFSTRARSFLKSAYHVEQNIDLEEIGGDDLDYTQNDNGTITPLVAANSPEFCIRVIENLINILTSGFNAVIYDSLVPWSAGGDNHIALYGSDSQKRLIFSALEKCMESMPIPGNIYRSEEINVEEDFTLKTLVMSTNADRFCFLLCRPVNPDALLGRLRLTINNPLWSTNYEVHDLAVTSFPEPAVVTSRTSINDLGQTVTTKTIGPGVDLSDLVMKPTMNLNSMSLFIKGVPYGGCCVIVTGKVRMKEIIPTPTPAPAPTPTPTPGDEEEGTTPTDSSPVVMQTIMQMPVNYGEPRFTNYGTGTVYYDSRDKTLKTYINGTWVKCNFLDYV